MAARTNDRIRAAEKQNGSPARSRTLTGWFYGFFGFLLLGKIQFHAQIASAAPTPIKFKPAAGVIYERQTEPPVLANSPIPSAVWILNSTRKTAHARKCFVLNTNDIAGKVVT